MATYSSGRDEDIVKGLDWVTILIYMALVIMGWLNIYAAVYDAQEMEVVQSLFDLNLNSGKQLLWIGTSALMIVMLMAIDFKFYDNFAYVIYGAVMLLLVAVLGAGTVVSGSKSWFQIGSFRLQPAEFAKFATALALARYLSMPNTPLEKKDTQLYVAAIIGLPALLILLQNDTGSMLVFSTFIFVLYREGLPGVYPGLALTGIILLILILLVDKYWLIGGMAVLAVLFFMMIPRRINNFIKVAGFWALCSIMVIGVEFVIENVMQPHQQKRLQVLVNPDVDPLGDGWNVTQSKIAIGSGGFWGKGFLEGTQTKFDFVPEQSTDFIFCTIGEEHGWIGTTIVIMLFIGLFMRLMFLAERQRTRFSRVYGYSVVSILFFHFMINIGMTIGLFPVIGIPLPFFSYGGSSLWSFSILLFIFLKLDAHRGQVLART